MLARHSIDFRLQSEDLPHPDNRVSIDRDGKVVLDIAQSSREAHGKLRSELAELLGPSGLYSYLFERSFYLCKEIPLSGTTHEAGTLRSGADPKSSVLDLNCKAHELGNLDVTDARFFPSIGAANRTLTIIANALGVTGHIEERLH